MDDEDQLILPLRKDGTNKRFWYDRDSHHVMHIDDEFTLWSIGYECRHKVQGFND